MAIESKYGTVTTTRGTIPTDEPVVIFRAQDQLLPDLLADYRRHCVLAGCPQGHLDSISDLHQQIVAWQETHPARVHLPD